MKQKLIRHTDTPPGCSVVASFVYRMIQAPHNEINKLRVWNALDTLTKKHTAFNSFRELFEAAGNYRPSFYINHKTREAIDEITLLANFYDLVQADRGDPRRAYRAAWGSIFNSALALVTTEEAA